MRAICTGSAKNYYPGTDGIVYWNSTMPVMDTALVSNIDALIAANRCIGYVEANAAGDSILDPFPLYGTSLSSFPQIVIDDANNLYFLWSSLTVGNPSPDLLNYRHIWGRAWYHNKPMWTEMKDMNTGVMYMFQEYVYPSVASTLKSDKIQLITQTSSQPGANIKDATIPIHDVSIEYREIPGSTFWPVGVDSKVISSKNTVSQNYPNPVKGITYFNVNLEKAANVIVEVSNLMGQKVMSMDKGLVDAGTQAFSLDGSQLTTGVYFYTVKVNGESYTHKMIVE
jgi:hypothetical protein